MELLSLDNFIFEIPISLSLTASFQVVKLTIKLSSILRENFVLGDFSSGTRTKILLYTEDFATARLNELLYTCVLYIVYLRIKKS